MTDNIEFVQSYSDLDEANIVAEIGRLYIAIEDEQVRSCLKNMMIKIAHPPIFVGNKNEPVS